jgi:hypothetical protein
MRCATFFLLAIFSVIANAAEEAPFTPPEIEAGKADRREAIKKLADDIDQLEATKHKTFNRNAKQSLAHEIAKKTRALNETKRKTPEDFARDRRAAYQEQQAKLTAIAKQKEEDAKADLDRMKVSGNCPLRVDFATFAHLSDEDSIALFHKVDAATTLGLTPISVIVMEVTNRSPHAVEAWQINYELLDGFDQVIHTGSHRNPLVASGEKSRVRLSTMHLPEAVQMRVYVERAKSSDGTLWERKPEHQQVGAAVKKLEGADLMKHVK